MGGKKLLASPNWYNSSVSDINADGIFAFGGKNTIFLIDLVDPECGLLGQLCGHKDRVTSVQFSKASVYSRLCVSGSEDHSVLIWDVDTKASVCKHSKHQSKVTAVSWSSAAHDWIFSGDEHGHIFSWNHQLNQVYQYNPIHGHIFCMSCSPEEEGLVVVGYKTGQILVISTKNEKHSVVSSLKGHNDEIHSLVWSPVTAGDLPKEIFGVANENRNGYVLASGSRDKTIKLWDLSSGQFIAVVNIPTRASARKAARDEPHVKSRLWTTLCWSEADPTCLLSSGYGGDVLLWDLSKASKQKWQLFGNGTCSRHSRIVFNICQYAAKDIIVTVSMDRLVNVWNRHDAKILCSLPTLGGFAYSLDIALMDPSSIAVGVGDNMIRIWETLSTREPYAVKTLWRGIGTKVMKVLWHPVKEGILAFGTEEGKVGIYNIMSQTCNVSRTYHKKSVYSLSWGPPCGARDQLSKDVALWHLYSCGGEGTVFQHIPDCFHDEAKNFDKLVKTTNNIKHNLAGHSEVSWKPDRSMVAIGNEDGSIHLYRAPDLKMISTINVHNRSITCLAWYYSQEERDSSSLLASSSNGFDIHIHDLKNIVEASGEELDEPAVVTSSYQRLVGHHGRVTNVVWSPHSSFLLASSSYDGTVQVWDVLKGEGLANYRGHCGRVMSVVWSIVDSDVLFSGGEDFTVRSWRISQQLFKDPRVEVKKPTRPKIKKKKKKSPAICQNAEGDQQEIEPEVALDEEQPSRETKVSDFDEKPKENDGSQDSVPVVPAISSNESNESVDGSLRFLTSHIERNPQGVFENSAVVDEPTLNVKGDAKKKKKKGKSLFPLSASADNRSRVYTSKECVEIAGDMNANEDTKTAGNLQERTINLGLFTNRESAFHMLTEEGIHHLQSGNIDYQLQLEVWKGNIGKALEMAVEKRQLTDWLVGLSHLAGEQVQLAVTEAFAEQLASQGNYHKAALYYLGCHKVYDAIHMFQKFGMYREAIALAKVRLLPSDPVLLDIYSSWARKLENESAFEQAAKCYLACGLWDDATRVLTRRSDEVALVAAAEVARLTGRMDLSEALILQCALSSTRNAKWNDALEMLRNYSNTQTFLMTMYTHKVLVVSLMRSGAISSEDFPDIQEIAQAEKISPELPVFVLHFRAQHAKRETNDSTSHWGSAEEDSYPVVKILEHWWSCCGLDGEEKRLHGFYVQIAALPFGQTTLGKEGVGQIVMDISKEICLGLVACLVGNPDLCLDHFLKAVVKCHDSGHSRLVQSLFTFLFPYGLESWYTIKGLSKSLKNTSKNVDDLFCNLLAFYYRALLKETLAALDVVTAPNLNQGEGENDEGSYLSKSESEQEVASHSQVPSSSGGTNFSKENVGKSMPMLGRMSLSTSDIYRIALVSSTVLLSELRAQVQHGCQISGNIGDRLGEDRTYQFQKIKGATGGGNKLEMPLLKSPFPDVIESARMVIDLYFKRSRIEIKENDEFKTLCQEVIAWTTRYVHDGKDKEFFETASNNLKDNSER